MGTVYDGTTMEKLWIPIRERVLLREWVAAESRLGGASTMAGRAWCGHQRNGNSMVVV